MNNHSNAETKLVMGWDGLWNFCWSKYLDYQGCNVESRMNRDNNSCLFLGEKVTTISIKRIKWRVFCIKDMVENNCDNNNCVLLKINVATSSFKRTKHVNARFLCIKDMLETHDLDLELEHCPKDNIIIG